jgi:LysR family transcriptional regulator, glycine cleavage system transcriptional activator
MEVFLYPLEIRTKIQYFFMVSMRMEHTSNAPGFYRRIPHLLAIEVFAMAARAGSFSGAARELKITQSAVSRQVQQLERSLGATLFVRHKGGLRLTSDGEAILPVVDEVFGRLAKVCDSVRNASQVLTLRMPPTLATRWFLPLLPSLRGALADVDVRITTYDAWQPRFEDNDIDAAIVQGRGDWPNVEVTRLMPELLTPVCSPALAQKLGTPTDLATLRLLHCDPLAAWGRWLDAAGLSDISARRGPTFDTLELALSAATRGQGVALGDLNLIRESIRDGILVAPFECVLDQGIAYYLVYPPHRAHLPKIRALREWLLHAATE